MAAKYPVKRPETAAELAKRFGVSERTVQRIMAQPRAEYESNSISRARPWDALGISRATWYRQGKPMPPAEDDGQQQDDDEAGESPAP